MPHRTTIAVDSRVRNRLRLYGRRGASYEEILTNLMDIVDPTAIPDPLDAIERLEPKTEDEITRWRAKSATEKVRMADELLKAALRSNPQGVRNVIRSRLKT